MAWINEIEKAKTLEDLSESCSINGAIREDFRDAGF